MKAFYTFLLLMWAKNNNPVCTWEAPSPVPVIKYEHGAMANVFWNDPSVIKEGDTYHMWLSGGDISKELKLDATLPYYASSPNGTDWTIDKTSLFKGSGAGTYDGYKVETPSVVKNATQYHMYYTSRSEPSDILSISHASSTLVNSGWKKDLNNPILSPSGGYPNDVWDALTVAEPAIVMHNGLYYLYFTAVGCRETTCQETYASTGTIKVSRTIGVAVSADGVNFGVHRKVLSQGPLYPEASGYEGYSTPQVFKSSSLFHMYYDVYRWVSQGDEQRQVALHHATSVDGFNWKEDKNPIFERTDFSWTGMEIRSPSVINDAGTFKMWFAGNAELPISGPDDAGIGYATCRQP